MATDGRYLRLVVVANRREYRTAYDEVLVHFSALANELGMPN